MRVRPNRYALALSTGEPLEAAVLALHECDVPLCVKVANTAAVRQHVVAGTQRDNMIRMAYTGRGGGRPVVRHDGLRARRARSVALHEAVRHGVGQRRGERGAARQYGTDAVVTDRRYEADRMRRCVRTAVGARRCR